MGSPPAWVDPVEQPHAGGFGDQAGGEALAKARFRGGTIYDAPFSKAAGLHRS